MAKAPKAAPAAKAPKPARAKGAAASAPAPAPARAAPVAPPANYEAGERYRVRPARVTKLGTMIFRPRFQYIMTGETAEKIKADILSAEKV